MQFGVSSACFYPQDLIKSIKMLAENNVKSMEIFANTESELTSEFAKEINNIIKSYDIKVCSVHPFTSGMNIL